MRLSDLTPEERKVFRQAFTRAILEGSWDKSSRENRLRASYLAGIAVQQWREHCSADFEETVKEADREVSRDT